MAGIGDRVDACAADRQQIRHRAQAGKTALRASFTMEEDAGLRFEQSAFGLVFASADRVEGTKAFVEKRDPKWQHK